MDYKGWFRVADRTRCDPLTVNDVFSRYSLLCEALVSPKLEDVRVDLEWCFREYGLLTVLINADEEVSSAGSRTLITRLGSRRLCSWSTAAMSAAASGSGSWPLRACRMVAM